MTRRIDVPVPGFPRVLALVWGGASGEEIWIRYVGTAADLTEAGVVTAEMLEPVPRNLRASRARRDEAGHRITVNRYFRHKDGVPHRVYSVLRRRPRELVGELPGASAAIEAHLAAFTVGRLRRLPYIRLVVDNTRLR